MFLWTWLLVVVEVCLLFPLTEKESECITMSTQATKKLRPVHEVRVGRIRAAIWENDTQNGTRHNVTLSRLYKDGERGRTRPASAATTCRWWPR